MKKSIPLLVGLFLIAQKSFASSYAIVVSQKTSESPEWAKVVDALAGKHDGFKVSFAQQPEEALPELSKKRPVYTCFVARPEEATREFVAQVHKLTSAFDADPYTDTIWGILTGFDAANALRIAQHAEPLTIRNAVSGTEFAMDMVQQGIWYSELEAGLFVEKENGEEPVRKKGPADSTHALVQHLNEDRTDLFITSGHATERDWMIGYSYKNGFFKCRPGQLFGIDTRGETTDIRSPNPKVYMPVGNCLMGHIDSRDAMALAWMNSGGVMQMIGYTVPTWYGYAGWGCLDYFVEQPGRYTFAEAVFANHQALVHRLATYFTTAPESENAGAPPAPNEEGLAAGLSASDARGLLFDRDVLAFYGDPAWQARMAPAPLPFDQELSQNGDIFTFTIKPNQGTDSFRTINNNGSQRGGRPFFALLPDRIGPAKIIEGGDLNPVITENFILVPRPKNAEAGKRYVIRFQAAEFKTP